MPPRLSSSLLFLVLLVPPPLAWSADQAADQRRIELQQRWEEIHYELPKAEQAQALAALAEQASLAVAAEPDSAALHTWQGITLATLAAAQGGMGALKLLEQARSSLERALAIDPAALRGAAYVTLGSLYHRAPPWPISFGDDDKAEALLEKAVQVDPEGMDSNYFYGDFLLDKRRYDQAREHLRKALNATPLAGRERTEQERREQIQAHLREIARRD